MKNTTNTPVRRRAMRLACALPLAAIAMAFTGTALAQTWPSKPIRIVIPYAVGGSSDITGRLIAKSLSVRLSQGTGRWLHTAFQRGRSASRLPAHLLQTQLRTDQRF